MEEAIFHNVVARGSIADNIVKYNHKWSKLYIEGYSRTRDWVKDWIKKYKTELIAEVVVFLNNKNNSNDSKVDEVTIDEMPAELNDE